MIAVKLYSELILVMPHRIYWHAVYRIGSNERSSALYTVMQDAVSEWDSDQSTG